MIKKKFFLSLLIVMGAALLAYPVFIERYLLEENVYRVSFPDLPAEFDGFRILVLTDLHYGAFMPAAWINHIIDRANRQDCDLIACLGDYVRRRNTEEEIREVWPRLARLKARSGVLMVLGNHDHWADSALSLRFLQGSGRSVRHCVRMVRRGNAVLAFAGAGDFYEDEAGLDRVLEKVPRGVFRIVLAHNPDTIDLPRKSRVDLFLAGHTHGGQFVVPFTGYSPLLPVKNKRYDKGLRKSPLGETVFICRGLGWAVLPVRLNCRPELAIVELKRG